MSELAPVVGQRTHMAQLLRLGLGYFPPFSVGQQQTLLRSILTATGRSYSDPVYNADGTVNMDASRRVEFKFSLKDAEMIDEMNRLLQGGDD